jgi:hypothetical protein
MAPTDRVRTRPFTKPDGQIIFAVVLDAKMTAVRGFSTPVGVSLDDPVVVLKYRPGLP